MTQRISHHVPAELLLDYASGSLSEAWSLVVATHLALCPSCRAAFEEIEAVGGELMEIETPSTMAEDAFELLMLKVDKDGEQSDAARPSGTGRDGGDMPRVLPEPLRSYLGGDLHSLKWKSFGVGVSQIPIATGDGLKARLLRVPAGKPVPQHGHRGPELTLVLAGSFSTCQGDFHRGDIEIANEDVEHQPVAGAGEDCICLAVTDAPLRFQSLAARLVQPFLGI